MSHQANLRNSPHTPNKSTPASSGRAPIYPTPQTPAQSTSDTSYGQDNYYDVYTDAKAPKDNGTIDLKMTQHNLKLEDEAYHRYPDFKRQVKEIINAAAVKSPSVKSEKRWDFFLKSHKNTNEATFFGKAVELIVKDGYFVLGHDDAATLSHRYFLLDEEVIIVEDSEFRGTLLPYKFMQTGFQKLLIASLKKVDGMKNPKPDMVFGLLPSRIGVGNKPPLSGRLYNLLTISKGIYHPFLLSEGKADRSLGEAVRQVRAGCSTAIHADHITSDLVGYYWGEEPITMPAGWKSPAPCTAAAPASASVAPAQPTIVGKADNHTFMFSFIVHPEMVKVYVHWREARLVDGEPDDIFHMNVVFSTTNDAEDALGRTRRVLHNIVHWGVGQRLNEHLQMWPYIERYSKEKVPLEAVEAREKAKARKRTAGTGTGKTNEAPRIEDLMVLESDA